MTDTEPESPSQTAPLEAWWSDILIATAFLTRVPLAPVAGTLGRAMRAFPIIGAGVGLVGAALYAIAIWLALPAFAAALLALAGMAALTGAVHEDGLADTADGFGGGRDADAKLAIMADSRTGSYGVLALLFSVGLRAGAIVSLAEPSTAALALIGAGAGSRAVLPAIAERFPTAREDGLAVAAGKPGQAAALWAAALGGAAILITLGIGTGIVAIAAAVAAAAAVALFAERQVGGYTGDVLGAAQQAAEIAILLAAAALAAS